MVGVNLRRPHDDQPIVLAVQDFRRDNRICGQFALAWFLHNLTGKAWRT